MGVIEKFVEERMRDILSGIDCDEMRRMSDSEILSELVEDFDSYLLVHVNDEDVIGIANADLAETRSAGGVKGGRDKTKGAGRGKIADANEARWHCMGRIVEVLRARGCDRTA